MDFSRTAPAHAHANAGSWHISKPGERWRMRHSDMRIVIGTDTWVAVAVHVRWRSCQNAHRSRAGRPGEHRPDLLGEQFDVEEAMKRIRARPEEEIADVMLTSASWPLGNEYKSECCRRPHPPSPASRT